MWSIVLEVFVLAVVLAAVTTFIMRVNKNQRSADALREQQAEQRLIQSNEALGQSLNELTNRIDDASQNLQEINIDRKTDTNETETQDNQM